jgi:hypothetical protein
MCRSVSGGRLLLCLDFLGAVPDAGVGPAGPPFPSVCWPGGVLLAGVLLSCAVVVLGWGAAVALGLMWALCLVLVPLAHLSPQCAGLGVCC